MLENDTSAVLDCLERLQLIELFSKETLCIRDQHITMTVVQKSSLETIFLTRDTRITMLERILAVARRFADISHARS